MSPRTKIAAFLGGPILCAVLGLLLLLELRSIHESPSTSSTVTASLSFKPDVILVIARLVAYAHGFLSGYWSGEPRRRRIFVKLPAAE
jgi:hypothetical protein